MIAWFGMDVEVEDFLVWQGGEGSVLVGTVSHLSGREGSGLIQVGGRQVRN